MPNDFSLIQKKAYEIGNIEDAFWVSKETSEHFSYFSVDSLTSLAKGAGLEKIIAIADLPIDFFLLLDETNYRKKKGDVGHQCHVACATLENAIYEESLEKAINMFAAMADAGIGRQITIFFNV